MYVYVHMFMHVSIYICMYTRIGFGVTLSGAQDYSCLYAQGSLRKPYWVSGKKFRLTTCKASILLYDLSGLLVQPFNKFLLVLSLGATASGAHKLFLALCSVLPPEVAWGTICSCGDSNWVSDMESKCLMPSLLFCVSDP